MSGTTHAMDTYLAIASLRVVREYADKPIPDAALSRILQAGRATGSSRNRQNWQFYVVRSRDTLNQLAEHVFAPGNLQGCQLAIAIVTGGKSAFDTGRVAQNMVLTAWADGIGTCPNSAKNRDEANRILGLSEDLSISTILSVGFPAHPTGPKDHDPDAILSRIDRKSLDEITRFID